MTNLKQIPRVGPQSAENVSNQYKVSLEVNNCKLFLVKKGSKGGVKKEQDRDSIPGNENDRAALICAKCGEQFFGKSFFRRHLIDVHGNDQEFSCNLCHNKFPKPHNLIVHLRTHIDRQYICDFCKKEYYRKPRFLAHLRKHTRPFVCDKCPKNFISEKHLARHTKTHTTADGEQPSSSASTSFDKYYFQCSHCDQVFGRKDR